MSAIVNAERIAVAEAMLRPETLDALRPEHFFSPKAAYCWQAMLDLYAKNSPIDPQTIEQQLTKTHGPSVADWAPFFIGECHVVANESPHAELHAEFIREEYFNRRAAIALGELIAKEKAGKLRGAELIRETVQAMAAIAVDDATDPTQTIGRVIRSRLTELERAYEAQISGQVAVTGVPTGVEKLDECTGGWPYKVVSLVAARPGMGKSSLGLATAAACARAGIGVHVFSLEDAGHTYADRVIAQTQRLPAENIRNLKMQRNTVDALKGVVSEFAANKNWIFDESTGITADEVVMRVRKHAKRANTKCVIVDYIQLLKWQKGATSTHEAMGMAITTLANAAKADGMAYVVMSQLNRGLEKRDNKRPVASDLRESGSLEERAKLIVGVHRDVVYNPEANAKEVELIIMKNSNGMPGTVLANWDGPTVRIW